MSRPLPRAPDPPTSSSNLHKSSNSSSLLTSPNTLIRLIQKTSYTHYRHLTCYAEYKAAKQETAKHSTHFPQFPALRERYTGAEKAKETAYIEAKNAASEAASKLNLFLQSLTSAVVLKKNDSEVATEAVRNSKEALKAAEESKRSLENLDTRFKRFVGRESIKPAAPDNETVQRLQDEVKQLKEGKAEMEKGFREYRTETETYMKGYQEKLERFMEAQAALRGDIGKIQEEREADKGEMKKEFKELLEEKMKKKEESVMVIDVEDETKLNARVVGVMSSLEERVVALEKALGQMQTMSSESKVNTNVSNSPPAAPPPWVPQDFPTQWDALLAETASIQSKLTLCDEAVEKANLAMTSSHDAIAEEFGRLQDNIDKLTLQTNETSHSLKAVSKSTDSTVEKLRTDTTYLINMHFPEMKTRIQQELQTALSTRFGNIDIRLANIEKHCTSQAQMLEGLNRFVEPLTEKINHLQPLGDKVNLLENAREAMEVAIQGMNNQMTNFQFKEITEKVAGMIGMQRVANVEKELNGIKGQVNALIAVSQKGQKAQAQQAQQVQGGQGKQVQQQPGPLKNGTEGMMVTNGAGSTSSMSPSVRAAVLARALETIQQEQQQQLSPTLYNSGNPAATPLNAVTSRLASLEDNLKHINSIVQPLAANTLNIQSLPPRLANLEKRLETQDAKLAIFSSNPPGFGKILTLENQMRNFEANVQNLMSTSSAEIRKLHENIAAVEQKLASSAAAVAAVNGESNSDATMNDGNENGGLPEGFLKEYAPGNLAALTEDLNDLRKQFELKVDYNLKQWAGKVKDNIQKIIKDVKELNTRFEEVVAAAAAGGGSGPGGGSLRDGGAGGVGLMSLEGVRQGSMGRGGSRGGSGGGSGGGSRGGSIDSEPTGGGALGGR